MILRSKIMKNTSVSNLNLVRSAELYFVRHVIFKISRSEIMKIMSISNLNLVRSAELYFMRHMIFKISRSEIVKIMCLTKESFAAAGGKRLFPNLYLKNIFLLKAADSRGAAFHATPSGCFPVCFAACTNASGLSLNKEEAPIPTPMTVRTASSGRMSR